MNRVRWHAEALPRRQQRVAAALAPVLTKRGFYLAGGTAVALHFGHRRSVDLDWFAPEFPEPERLADELRDHGVRFITDSIAPGTLHGVVHGVRVTLLRHRYPMTSKLKTGFLDIRIAGLADLAAMKLLALAQRGAKKDFVDIYALGRSRSLRQMIRSYQAKYSIDDLGHVLRALVYFEDANRERMPRMFWKTRWRDVKMTIQTWVRQAQTLEA